MINIKSILRPRVLLWFVGMLFVAPVNALRYAPAMALATKTRIADNTTPATRVPVTVSSGFICYSSNYVRSRTNA